MKSKITKFICSYVENYSQKLNNNYNTIKTTWRTPIISFGSSTDSLFHTLKEVVSPSHLLPIDIFPNGQTIISYFLPFDENIIKSNIDNGKYSSNEWGYAYIETNQLIEDINESLRKYLFDEFQSMSYYVPPTGGYDEKKLMSDFSHRHVGYICGLGKFGMNNMLITEKGCCGRIGTMIIDMKIEPTKRKKEELCLNKLGKGCRKCFERCEFGGLTNNGFNRFICRKQLLKSGENFMKNNEDINEIIPFCGKCLVDLPCSNF